MAAAGHAADLATPNPALCPGDRTDPALLAFFPAEVRGLHLEGLVGVSCRIGEHGAVSGCVVKDEHPDMAGFGEAALAMLATSRGNPDVSLTPAQTARPVSFNVAFALDPPRISPNLMGPAHRIEPPIWRQMPTDADIYLAYPLRAAHAHLAGLAVLNCSLHISGALFNCGVASEKPTGEGFGAHALALVDRVQMMPMKCDGVAIEGARVNVPIRFKPPPRTFQHH